jgi:hypothetical protein
VESAQKNIDYLCCIIDKLIDSADGVIRVDLEKGTIHDLAQDLEDDNGLLPIEIVAPYIEYLINK